jgi:hypothetical protein
MKRLAWTTLLLLAAACGKEPSPGGAGGGTKAPPAPPDNPALPSTGAPRVREMRETLRDEIERMEKELADGKMPERRFVDLAKRGIENLTIALRRALAEESRQTVRREHSAMMAKQGAIEKERVEVFDSIRVVQTQLDQAKQGAGRLPEGFTEDELKDRVADLRKKALALDEAEKELRAGMKEKEDLLALETVPPQGETLFTHEMEAVNQLKARLEAIDAKVK